MNQNALCYGQRGGHNFPFPGGNCLNCDVNQNDLSGRVQKKVMAGIARPSYPQKPAKGMHSELHLLVDNLRKQFGETAKSGRGSFGFYLGHLKRIGFQEAYTLWREVAQAKCNNPGRLFWWKYKQLVESKKHSSQRNDNV